VGELHVPGWSERMFFHDDRLFAVGIDDQPTENEDTRWVSRVALSLFDVKDPTQPTLINRFTPLVGETNYSSSPALSDERALLLDWDQAFAALPIDSYETQSGSHLQIVSLANDEIEDAGRLETQVSIQRSLSLAPDVLAALGDQALLTLRWGQGDPQILGELELATNVTWLNLQSEQLWAAARGNNGFHRFYRYTTDDLEIPAERWQLPNGYEGVKMDNNLVVFYDSYPALAVQVLNVNTGELQAAQVLETQQEPPVSTSDASTVMETAIDTKIAWYNRGQALLHDGWFYVAEQRAFQPAVREQTAHLLMPETTYDWQAEWVLRRWNMTLTVPTEAQSLSIPGNPLAFTENGELITQEFTNKGLLRLNLLALDIGNASLLHSRELLCQGYSQVIWASDTVYVSCEKNGYGPGPIVMEDTVNESSVDDENNQDEPEPPPEQQPQPTTQVLRLNPGQGFTEDGSWTLEGYRNIHAASSEVVLLGARYGWYEPWLAEDDVDVAVEPTVRSLLPNYQNGCDVYQLRPDNAPVLLKHLESCPYNEGLVLTPTQAWMAEGFAGIKVVNW
jgi:hypothetical protein